MRPVSRWTRYGKVSKYVETAEILEAMDGQHEVVAFEHDWAFITSSLVSGIRGSNDLRVASRAPSSAHAVS